jgi:hypothetical protein
LDCIIKLLRKCRISRLIDELSKKYVTKQIDRPGGHYKLYSLQ